MAEISEREMKARRLTNSAEPKFIMRIEAIHKERLRILAKAHHLDMTAYIQMLLKNAWEEYLIVNQEEK